METLALIIAINVIAIGIKLFQKKSQQRIKKNQESTDPAPSRKMKLGSRTQQVPKPAQTKKPESKPQATQDVLSSLAEQFGIELEPKKEKAPSSQQVIHTEEEKRELEPGPIEIPQQLKFHEEFDKNLFDSDPEVNEEEDTESSLMDYIEKPKNVSMEVIDKNYRIKTRKVSPFKGEFANTHQLRIAFILKTVLDRPLALRPRSKFP